MADIINIIGFSNYYALFGIALTPLIWIIVKSFPPIPKSYSFSSFFLLEKIDHDVSKNNKTPLWLIIFRTLLFIFIVLFFSKPFLKNNKSLVTEKYEKYVVIADLGWSVAKDWSKFKELVLEIGKEAEKNKKKLVFFHSGLNKYENSKIFETSGSLNSYLESLSPFPLQFTKSSLEQLKKDESSPINSKVFIISSNFDFIEFSDQLTYFDLIKKNNNNDYYFINPIETILFIKDLEINQDKIICTISRLGKNNFKENFLLNIETINNEIVYNKNHIIQENKSNYIINLGLPNEIQIQVKQ